MAQYNQDLLFSAGNDISIRFEGIYDESDGQLVLAGDILGVTWAITSYEESMTPLISKSLSGGGISVPEDGVVLVSLDAVDTEDLSGEFSHELRLLDGDNDVITAARGKVTIKYQIASNPL